MIVTTIYDNDGNIMYRHEHLNGIAFDDAVEMAPRLLGSLLPKAVKAVVSSKTKGSCEITAKITTKYHNKAKKIA